MKKLITLLLAVAGMVGTASSADNAYLLCDYSESWNSSDTSIPFQKIDGDHFRLILNPTWVSRDFYFRFKVETSGSYNVWGVWPDGSDYYDYPLTEGISYGAKYDSESKCFIIRNSESNTFDEDAVLTYIELYWSDSKWNVRYYNRDAIDYTACFVKPSDWAAPKIYTWDSDGVELTGAWSGTAMIDNQDGTYSYTVKAPSNKSTKVIFTDGTNQVSAEGWSLDTQVYDKDGAVGDQTFEVGPLGYATFSSIYPLDIAGSEAVKAYRATVTDGKVVLHQVTGSIPAKTGLVLAGAADATATVSPIAGISSIGDNLLKASVTATELTYAAGAPYRYFLAGSDAESVGFYYLASDQTSAAGKAYLETTTALANTTADARVAWTFADEVTGITSSNRETINNNCYYDLQGRRIVQPTKGLYIINGKKIIY